MIGGLRKIWTGGARKIRQAGISLLIASSFSSSEVLSLAPPSDYPSKFFLALQSFCSRLSVVLLSCDSRSTLIRRDRTKKFGRVEQQQQQQQQQRHMPVCFLLLLLSSSSSSFFFFFFSRRNHGNHFERAPFLHSYMHACSLCHSSIQANNIAY